MRDREDSDALVDCLYLYREFSSEGIRMLLPVSEALGSKRRVSSFVAALELGLRRRFPLSGQGANLKTLIDIAGRLKLGARALRADLESIRQLQLPCILHWDLNHR